MRDETADEAVEVPVSKLAFTARRLSRNWLLPAVGLVVLLVGGYLAIPSRLFLPGQALWGMMVGPPIALFGLVLMAASFSRNSYARARRVAVSVDPAGLSIDRERRVLAKDVEYARIVSKPGKWGEVVLELGIAGRQIALWMSRSDAQHISSVLGLLAGDRRARFRLAPNLAAQVLLGVFGGAGWFALAWKMTGESYLELAVLAALLLGWIVGLLSEELTVAADGFTKRWLFTSYVSFAKVRSITATPLANGEVETQVVLHSGAVFTLRAREHADHADEQGAESQALNANLRTAFERYQRGGNAQDLVSLLSRGARDDVRWAQDILSLPGTASYRAMSVEPETLLMVVGDPSVAPECRIAAGAALVKSDPSQRERLRILSQGCAQERVRLALAEVSEAEDEEQLRESLQRFSRS